MKKGGNESSSWHRVMKMKVTKKTERTSKTEKCTKTYKVSGSNGDGGDGNQQFITVDKTITLPPSNADKVCTTLHMILPILEKCITRNGIKKTGKPQFVNP